MHGRIKVRTTAEQEAIKKAEREKKIIQYKAAINLVFQKRKDQIYDDELLLVTEKMLLQNPDINTIWNIRREAFEKNEWSKEERAEQLKKELTLIENCLRENPKSYSAWHHRCWVIEHQDEPDWKTELALCAKCLNLDERNFHCWDYRNYMVKKAGIPDEEEFEFSTTKIINNISNYSSWHYRSKILSKMFPDESGKLPINPDKHKEELDLVMNATFTDPDDSSAWFYQRWLLDYKKSQPNTLWRVKVGLDKATAIFHEDTSIKTVNFSLVLMMGGEEKDKITSWQSPNEKNHSKVWFAQLPPIFQDDKSFDSIFVEFNGNIYNLDKFEDGFWYYKSVDLLQEQSDRTQLKEQMDNYDQLAKMEPNNKWALLTGIFLMKNYNFVKYHEKILNDLSALINIDNLHANYYADIRSKYIMDYKLHTLWKEEKDLSIHSTIDLSNLELTVLYNEHFLTYFEEVNLSGNRLSYSLQRLNVLQDCKKLSLSNNQLKCLKNFPIMNNLQYLSLRNNELTDIDEILSLLKKHERIIVLDLRDNPLWNSNQVISQILNEFPDLQLQMD